MKATSLEANRLADEFKNTHGIKILSVLKNSKIPLTYKEIANRLNWSDPNRVSRRMSELVGLDLVKEKEARKCTIANRNCTTYIIK